MELSSLVSLFSLEKEGERNLVNHLKAVFAFLSCKVNCFSCQQGLYAALA